MYSVCTGLTQLYLLVEYKVFCVYKVQLHVSVLDNGHLQVVHEITDVQCVYWCDTAAFIGRI
jgi:hypothetical protein